MTSTSHRGVTPGFDRLLSDQEREAMTRPWFRNREAWAFIARRYLPWLAGLNLAWEALQIPLYAIWTEASAGYIAFAVVHCTLGDVLIGFASLVLALMLGRESRLACRHRSSGFSSRR